MANSPYFDPYFDSSFAQMGNKQQAGAPPMTPGGGYGGGWGGGDIFAGMDPKIGMGGPGTWTRPFYRDITRRMIPSIMDEINFLVGMAPQRRQFLSNTITGFDPENVARDAAGIGRQAEAGAAGRIRGLAASNPMFEEGADFEAANVGNEASSDFLSNLFGPEGRMQIMQLLSAAFGEALGAPMLGLNTGIERDLATEFGARGQKNPNQQNDIWSTIGNIAGLFA